jgi:hypothetical protein
MGPITMAPRPKAWTVFARSKAGNVSSNPTQCMDVCERLFRVWVTALRGADPPSKESYRVYMGVRKWKSDQGQTKGL